MIATTPTNSAIDGRHLALAGIILLVHLAVNVVHAVAHAEIPVVGPLPLAVILLTYFLSPIVGVVLLWRGPRCLGAAVFTLSMVAAFGIGLAFHFLVENPDNVAAVGTGPWSQPFRLSAAASLPIDALAAVLGGWLWWQSGGADGGHAAGDGADPPQSGRIEGVPDAGFRPLTRLSYWGARQYMGETPDSLRITAHSPPILVGTNAVEMALDRAGAVDDRLVELAVLKAASVVGCEFCLDIGTAQALELGITETQLRSLHEFEDSDAFTERERLVLRYAVAMTATPPDVPTELFEALADEFDETALVELTAAIAFENHRARFNRALDIDAQGFTEGEFCPRPEPSAGVGQLRPGAR